MSSGPDLKKQKTSHPKVTSTTTNSTTTTTTSKTNNKNESSEMNVDQTPITPNVGYYVPLPNSVTTGPLQSQLQMAKQESTGAYVEKLTEQLIPSMYKEKLMTNLSSRILFLENLTSSEQAAKNAEKLKELKSKSKKSVSAKEKREKGWTNVKLNNPNYEQFIALNKLWKQYVAKMLDQASLATAEQRILKCDFHGSIVTVKESKNPTLIGQSGIVIQETHGTFKIINKQNGVRVIPKENTIFLLYLELENFPSVILYGNHICYDPAERSAKKFKGRDTIEMK